MRKDAQYFETIIIGTGFSYKGITVSGYPNYFKVNGPNTGTGHSSQLCYMETMVKTIEKT